jgi:hypothetical protein
MIMKEWNMAVASEHKIIAKYDHVNNWNDWNSIKMSTKSTADYEWTTKMTGTMPLDASWTPGFRNKD